MDAPIPPPVFRGRVILVDIDPAVEDALAIHLGIRHLVGRAEATQLQEQMLLGMVGAVAYNHGCRSLVTHRTTHAIDIHVAPLDVARDVASPQRLRVEAQPSLTMPLARPTRSPRSRARPGSTPRSRTGPTLRGSA
jgi:hypothetical protein